LKYKNAAFLPLYLLKSAQTPNFRQNNPNYTKTMTKTNTNEEKRIPKTKPNQEEDQKPNQEEDQDFQQGYMQVIN